MEKKKLIDFVFEKTRKRVDEIELAIKNVQEAANEESKSSAGDKYETGRAMAQNDRAILENQLLAAQNDLGVLTFINFDQNFDSARLGSIVETSIGVFFLSVSIGKVDFEKSLVMIISGSAPIGKLLLNKAEGDEFTFNKRKIKINKIY